VLRALSTVRAKAAISAGVIVAVTLVAGAIVLTVLVRRSLVDDLNAAARARAEDVAALLRAGAVPGTLAVHGEEDAVVQVVAADGTVLAASANLEGQGPLREGAASGGDGSAHPFTARVRTADDVDELRVLPVAVDLPSGRATVYIGSNLDRVDETIQTIVRILAVGIPLLALIVGGTTWYLVGRSLRPVEAIRSEVAEISAKDLSRRVPEPATQDEIGRLARTMNQTLDRLADSIERQRRFVADASHELQSPVASAQVVLDVAMAHPETTDWPAVATDLQSEHRRIELLLRDLLFLARSENGAPATALAWIDLDDVVRGEVERLRARTSMRIEATGVEPVEVRADAEQLARAIRNLLENAATYATSLIVVTTRDLGDRAEVAVTDDGPGVPPADRERIFERFARTSESRDRHTGGTGLGLAIARDIVTAHHGTIEVVDSAVGARFVITLPRDQPT
jgi:signal transduction histidine kinase